MNCEIVYGKCLKSKDCVEISQKNSMIKICHFFLLPFVDIYLENLKKVIYPSLRSTDMNILYNIIWTRTLRDSRTLNAIDSRTTELFESFNSCIFLAPGPVISSRPCLFILGKNMKFIRPYFEHLGRHQSFFGYFWEDE